MRSLVLSVMLAAGIVGSALAHAEDAAPEIKGLINYRAPLYPIGLPGITNGAGDVVMVMTIDAQGKVEDSFAILATDEPFVAAVKRAIPEWQFAPTASSTYPRREILEFNFRRSGVVTAVTHLEATSEEFITTRTAKIKTVQWAELDAEPKKIHSPVPSVSVATLKKQAGKPLLINFIVDEYGKTRVPVVNTDDAQLAQAVLKAVREWRYSPPIHQGKPVAVEVTRQLTLPGGEHGAR